MGISGIYKITNNITGDFYIGSSKNIKQRWAHHKSPSAWAHKPRMKLYQAFVNYGLNSFTFEIIEETNNLCEREQYWIEYLKPVYNDRYAKGWNNERYRKYRKERYMSHQDEWLNHSKEYNCRLCLYNGESLTLSALSNRFRRQGIPHATLEAKKYLLENTNE